MNKAADIHGSEKTRAAPWIGVDTGGTHTDIVLVENEAGRLITLKVPSTPGDLSDGIIEGLEAILREAGSVPDAVERFVYASTLVTNLIVEEREASVGLITTEGFRDLLEIRRASRKPHIYDIHWRPPHPLVPRALRMTVPERLDHRGNVLVPLDEDAARAALTELAEAGVTSIAVCLLHAYANPAHEQQIARLAAEICPDVVVSVSSEVVREFREYERTSTTCINAYVKQPITTHLDTLGAALGGKGMLATPCIMRGNGGISTFESAKRLPAAITHSGPMGGIVGAAAIGAAAGLGSLITLDMGGTSADVSVFTEGTPQLTNRGHIGPHPLLVPMLDLVTIGAGGGSIAWLDDGKAMRVGPRSAGAVPGPACYDAGGIDPTVTDANLLAGRLNADYFLHGSRSLNRAAAEAAMMKRIATPLGLSLSEAALGVLAIAEAHMANAIRLVSVNRGLDPRDFTLVAFGGAGPLHAVALADELSIGSVLIPPAPGNVSAMGLLTADVRHEVVRTNVVNLAELGPRELEKSFQPLLEQARESLASEKVPMSGRRYLLNVDLRYQGQNYELNLPLGEAIFSDETLGPLIDRFHAQHRIVYGYDLRDRMVQLVNLRVTAVGEMPAAAWPAREPAVHAASPVASRVVMLPGASTGEAVVYRFVDLRPTHTISGPAIVEYPGSTLFVPPGWAARYDERANALVERTTN